MGIFRGFKDYVKVSTEIVFGVRDEGGGAGGRLLLPIVLCCSSELSYYNNIIIKNTMMIICTPRGRHEHSHNDRLIIAIDTFTIFLYMENNNL